MMSIKLSDGEGDVLGSVFRRAKIKTIVVSVHGRGPAHILFNRWVNYYDMLADGFCEGGLLCHNRRGVDLGDVAPWYDTVDSANIRYLPHIEAEDIETMIAFLKKDPRFANCKIILYGISGRSFAVVADRKKVQVDALFLHGYAHENLHIIEWRNSGEGVMISAILNSM